MGVDEKDIDKLILKQLCVWFGLPVTVAVITALILAVYFFLTIGGRSPPIWAQEPCFHSS